MHITFLICSFSFSHIPLTQMIQPSSYNRSILIRNMCSVFSFGAYMIHHHIYVISEHIL